MPPFPLLLLLLLVLVSPSQQQQQLEVTTAAGIVRGEYTPSARVFRGIPYAEPPVGDLRFSSPVPHHGWSGVLNATTDGPACPQTCTLRPHQCPPVTNEDCLYLNVFTPLSSSQQPQPVMVWIHGGDYFEGYGSSPFYDGSYVANVSGVIVVTLNYRLGVLGFMASSTLNLTGNYAIEDQAMVLQWVATNIKAFGGDPSRVTLFGQSAGAISTAIHLYSPLSRGLFHQAMIFSLPMSLHFRTLADWTSVSEKILKTAGCADLACMRAQPYTAINAVQDKLAHDVFLDLRGLVQVFLPWTPVTGSSAVPMTPLEAFLSGASVIDPSIPFIIGDTRDEATLFVYLAFKKRVGILEYDVVLDLLFGKAGHLVRPQYPPNTGATDARPAMASAGTDALFFCANRNATLTLMSSSSKQADRYVYMYDHVQFDKASWGSSASFCGDQVCHGADVPWIFNTLSLFNTTDAERTLSRQMVEYFTSFAHTGVPQGNITWPAYNSVEKKSIRFQTGTLQVDSGYDAHNCSYWDQFIGYVWP